MAANGQAAAAPAEVLTLASGPIYIELEASGLMRLFISEAMYLQHPCRCTMPFPQACLTCGHELFVVLC